MRKEKSIWFIELILRVIAVVSIGFILLNVWSIYNVYNNTIAESNPMLSRTIAPYTAFPHYFFIAFYGGILVFIWRCLKSHTARKFWYISVLAIFFFEFFKMYIYGFLMWVNVYG